MAGPPELTFLGPHPPVQALWLSRSPPHTLQRHRHLSNLCPVLLLDLSIPLIQCRLGHLCHNTSASPLDPLRVVSRNLAMAEVPRRSLTLLEPTKSAPSFPESLASASSMTTGAHGVVTVTFTRPVRLTSGSSPPSAMRTLACPSYGKTTDTPAKEAPNQAAIFSKNLMHVIRETLSNIPPTFIGS